MNFELGEPEHGWVDLKITDGEFILQDDISDVPCDFIDQIVVALSRLLTYEHEQQIELSLELAYYILTLSRKGKMFSLSIVLNFPDSIRPDENLHNSIGNFDKIIRPIFHEVIKFYKNGYCDPHWPEGDDVRIKQLIEIEKQRDF